MPGRPKWAPLIEVRAGNYPEGTVYGAVAQSRLLVQVAERCSIWDCTSISTMSTYLFSEKRWFYHFYIYLLYQQLMLQ